MMRTTLPWLIHAGPGLPDRLPPPHAWGVVSIGAVRGMAAVERLRRRRQAVGPVLWCSAHAALLVPVPACAEVYPLELAAGVTACPGDLRRCHRHWLLHEGSAEVTDPGALRDALIAPGLHVVPA
ncbi:MULTISPECIES: hypothetical protein [Streptomyces]|uniref:hypothetical protein n=1 Tax=Streptomyces TaxID=1883 RepID=UPI0022498DC2|nr:hypothetical protein [Streptomyces sp. JHD 1]MCX2968228.1 hypothetical protein [Streptomyces sp. JHD 1]